MILAIDVLTLVWITLIVLPSEKRSRMPSAAKIQEKAARPAKAKGQRCRFGNGSQRLGNLARSRPKAR